MLTRYLDPTASALHRPASNWAIGANHMEMAGRLLGLHGHAGKWTLPKLWKDRLKTFGLSEDLEIVDHPRFALCWEMVTTRHPERPHYRLRYTEFMTRFNFVPWPKDPQATEIVTPGFKKRKTPDIKTKLATKQAREHPSLSAAQAQARIFNQRAKHYLSDLQDED